MSKHASRVVGQDGHFARGRGKDADPRANGSDVAGLEPDVRRRFGVGRRMGSLGCLFVVSCELGMFVSDGDDTYTDPLTFQLRGSEPAVFEITIEMQSSQPLSSQATIHADAPNISCCDPGIPVIMSLACEGLTVQAVDLFDPASFRAVAQVVDPVLSPGEVKCIVAFTPEAELRGRLTIQWTVRVSLAPSPDERDDPIEVSIDVTEAGDGSPRRTRG